MQRILVSILTSRVVLGIRSSAAEAARPHKHHSAILMSGQNHGDASGHIRTTSLNSLIQA
jgi:hypothetical protein